ncbi:uncharacterized protein [Onthophagus taurus]|uniref:uncharacterized protein isoform X4 n=1 Tax=Onthophagus taurus TaxID=166361 RepID=UPI0039BDF90C
MSDETFIYYCLTGLWIFCVIIFAILKALCKRSSAENVNNVSNQSTERCRRRGRRRPTNQLPLTNQDDDVWNISSRVNQQNQDGTPPNWPTHDHRLSMDFVITPEYNIKDTRPPPPPYSELDLPSYEQATGCRPPRADLTPVHQQSDQNRPGPSS